MTNSHGMSSTRIYKVYYNILERTTNEKHNSYKHYGLKGIRSEWNSFPEFYRDMGDTYVEGLTIERRDNDLNYSKSNCTWVTKAKQHRNTSMNLVYEDKCLAEWCEELGHNYHKIYSRIKRGSTIKDALGI